MSKIHRFSGNPDEDIYTWEEVQPLLINQDEVQNILKHVLIGPDDGSTNFTIRYFQVPVGGKTFFHRHEHEHGMLILHGKAKIQINDDFFELNPLDSLYVSGEDLHQITNIGDAPLGFLCIIPGKAKEL